MIDVHERFSVPADPRTVWAVISDPRAVVGCVPGAALGEPQEDGALDASVAVRFGPVGVTFRARVTLELDAAARVGRVTARGRDSQGGTRFTSTATFVVTESDGGGSTVAIDGAIEIGGKLASLIEGGAPVVVRRMSSEFVSHLATRCAAGGAGPAGQREAEGDVE